MACDWWPAILSSDWLLQGGLVSLVWTVVMVRLQCCGVTGHEDFRHSPAWTRDTKHTQQVGGFSLELCKRLLSHLRNYLRHYAKQALTPQ